MIDKITLSGFAGSGKSTIGKNLQEALNFEFISVGNFSRKLANEEYKMTINAFQQKCTKNPKLDAEIDKKFQIECNSKDNLVIDYRLGFKFIQNAFHVLLKVSDQEAVSRIKAANRTDETISAKAIDTRNENMRTRFLSSYNVDFTNEKNYHLLIDTDSLTPKEITNLIIEEFKKITI
ncbi:Cytidylate kinase [Kordia antarctica]|uniref:Cytidylate kinase n=1 Tax=Kordia antarctica TaxID=1218801 RepID=A0A7L4ZQQ9_9FLAO|nr:cytidylate kinase family protein [Kordia antarctica]QHI38932.1 Cytidylate kinase [Kordia antarctica]